MVYHMLYALRFASRSGTSVAHLAGSHSNDVVK
jgi:hypothetical protein